MSDLTHVPYARPVQTTVTRVEAQLPLVSPVGVAAAGGTLGRCRTDGFAVASAICGMTAIIPFVSQVIGLGFAVVSLTRIRRARRAGIGLVGAKWAAVGMISSGFALICWVGIFVAMGLLNSSLSHSVDSLNVLLPVTP